MSRSLLLGLALGLTPALFTAACAADPAAEAAVKPAHWPFTTIEAARFDEPWAMAFLPDSLRARSRTGSSFSIHLCRVGPKLKLRCE